MAASVNVNVNGELGRSTCALGRLDVGELDALRLDRGPVKTASLPVRDVASLRVRARFTNAGSLSLLGAGAAATPSERDRAAMAMFWRRDRMLGKMLGKSSTVSRTIRNCPREIYCDVTMAIVTGTLVIFFTPSHTMALWRMWRDGPGLA